MDIALTLVFALMISVCLDDWCLQLCPPTIYYKTIKWSFASVLIFLKCQLTKQIET